MAGTINNINAGGTVYGIGAESLTSQNGIDGLEFNGSGNVTRYAVCSTAASTAEKTVTLGANFTLAAGAAVYVKFVHANSAENPTLNVNDTGAKPILYSGGTPADSSAWDQGEVLTLLYDGTSWNIEGGGVYAMIAQKQDQLTFDNTPTAGSSNPVTSGGVESAVSQVNQTALGAYPHATASGSVASFADGADNIPVRSLTAQIVPVQAAGTPSPENPLPISGWSGANVSDGSNILDLEFELGTINASGTPSISNDNMRSVNFTPVSPSTKYTLINKNGKAMRWFAYKADGTFIARSNSLSQTTEITTQANCAKIKIVFAGTSYGNDIFLADKFTTYSVTFPASAGTVCGGTLRDNGDDTWTLKSKPYYASYNGEALVGPWVSSMDVYAEGVTPTMGAQVVDLGGTETEYTISADSVKTLLGSNNIFVDCGDVSVDYRADTTLYIEGKVNAIMATIANL